jgi:hydroxylation protein CepL
VIDRTASRDQRDYGDPDLYLTADRFGLWRELRARDRPVWSGPGTSPNGFWSVFTHGLSSAVLGPAALFTSEHGMMIGFDGVHRDAAGGQMLVVSDGARHARLRGLIGPFLSRAMAGSLRGFVRQEVAGTLAQPLRAGGADAAREIGPLIPAAVVCEILGVPPGDRARLIELTNHAFGGADSAFDRMTPAEAHTEILMYFHGLIEEKRRRPDDGLIGTMLADGALRTRDVLLNCDNVLIGGNETTRHAIAGTFHALSTAPGALDRLRETPAMLGTMVEEIIRWTSPAMHALRVATADTDLGGEEVLAGQAVAVWLPSANRDARVFSEPDRFRPDRSPNRHLGFGHGPHHCLGAALARVELGVMLEFLARRVRSVHLAEQPLLLRSNLVQGYRRVTVRFEARPPSS